MTNRPTIVTDEHLAYLDDLRESGRTNMLGAGRYLIQKFLLTSEEAKEVLGYWMETFGEDER